jgi:hypothetical protein
VSLLHAFDMDSNGDGGSFDTVSRSAYK